MKASFWHQKWAEGDTAFHSGKTHTFLKAHLKNLKLGAGGRIFLPLCGKTRDIAWLLAQGYQVVGVELSEFAIKQLFDELGIQPTIRTLDKFSLYQALNIDIFVGDIFDLNRLLIGQVHGIYDRAALVALPAGMRRKYTRHLLNLTDGADQLLITFEYPQELLEGPPFSIPASELVQLYTPAYQVLPLASQDVPGGLKGLVTATESVWQLRKVNQ